MDKQRALEYTTSKMVIALARMSPMTTPLFINGKFVCELSIEKSRQLEDAGVITVTDGVAQKVTL